MDDHWLQRIINNDLDHSHKVYFSEINPLPEQHQQKILNILINSKSPTPEFINDIFSKSSNTGWLQMQSTCQLILPNTSFIREYSIIL